MKDYYRLFVIPGMPHCHARLGEAGESDRPTAPERRSSSSTSRAPSTRARPSSLHDAPPLRGHRQTPRRATTGSSRVGGTGKSRAARRHQLAGDGGARGSGFGGNLRGELDNDQRGQIVGQRRQCPVPFYDRKRPFRGPAHKAQATSTSDSRLAAPASALSKRRTVTAAGSRTYRLTRALASK